MYQWYHTVVIDLKMNLIIKVASCKGCYMYTYSLALPDPILRELIDRKGYL